MSRFDDRVAIVTGAGSGTGQACSMGDEVVLRPVRERDLAAFIDAHTEISNRGQFFPFGVLSEPALRRAYAETGLGSGMRAPCSSGTGTTSWSATPNSSGRRSATGTPTSSPTSCTAKSTPARVHDRGVRLLVDYLSGAKKDNRLSLVILPENAPSRRIADRCGFQLEGTARGALFHGGRSVDVLIYSLRDDPRPRPPA